MRVAIQCPASLYGCSEPVKNVGKTTPGISVQQFYFKLQSPIGIRHLVSKFYKSIIFFPVKYNFSYFELLSGASQIEHADITSPIDGFQPLSSFRSSLHQELLVRIRNTGSSTSRIWVFSFKVFILSLALQFQFNYSCNPKVI